MKFYEFNYRPAINGWFHIYFVKQNEIDLTLLKKIQKQINFMIYANCKIHLNPDNINSLQNASPELYSKRGPACGLHLYIDPQLHYLLGSEGIIIYDNEKEILILESPALNQITRQIAFYFEMDNQNQLNVLSNKNNINVEKELINNINKHIFMLQQYIPISINFKF